MKYITVKLTEDQLDWVFLTIDYELEQETHRIKKTMYPESQRKHVAYVRRIRDKLAKAKLS